MAKSKGSEKNFETSLSALESIVAQLESGDLPLNRALELFEEGVGLARQCQSQLQDAERKVELLLRERGEIKVVPFETADGNRQDESNQSVQQAPIDNKASSFQDDEDDDLDEALPF